MEVVILFAALFVMPVVSFFFMYLFLNILKDEKEGQKFLASILFAIMGWIISSSIILNLS
ncbi:hypothetical protein [Paenibacillus herberti]|uniref:Uncharacterized protein n=1 Tax=Paenibacillus herberti TaxID=1619309 RepID=A0A229P0V8_9BACL|nr:hypothetical protein [Paenibacillus herberti]OXM15886.1 hypothetical protein CGZ75_04000 [Paenibacillus herberti]